MRFRKRPEHFDADQVVADAPPSTPPPPPSPPAVAAPSASGRPEPVSVVPWGIRVGAEVGWRLLVLAAILWVLIRVIGAVHLIVLSFAAALLITALLQPTVARLQKHRVPKGLATVATALCGFVLLGLVGWFVVWQVMDNVDDLTDQLQSGVDDLKHWLLKSPFHITEARLDHISDKLGDSIGSSSDQLTAAGLHGVTVLAELLTGVLLTVFSTLFLLYDGPRIWKWALKFAPASARSAIDGAALRPGTRSPRTYTARSSSPSSTPSASGWGSTSSASLLRCPWRSSSSLPRSSRWSARSPQEPWP